MTCRRWRSLSGMALRQAYVLVDIIISSLNSGLSVSMCAMDTGNMIYTLYICISSLRIYNSLSIFLVSIYPPHNLPYIMSPAMCASRHTYHRSISQLVTSTAPPGCFPSSCAESSPSPSRSPLGSLSSSSLSEPVAQPPCIPP
jgi:hypothetical protein